MKELTEKELLENYKKFVSIIENNFSGERKECLLKLVNHFEERLILSPASYKEHYHNSYIGGYLEHVLNVYHIALDLFEIWKKYSVNIDYTLEELTLVTLFHDLGKLGDINEEFYLPQDNEWRRQNMGEIYKINPKVVNMNGADRSLYLLQHFGVKLTQNEWITIKIHEGMYEEANGYYLKVTSDSSVIKSHLPHLMHHADMMATRTEYEKWKKSNDVETGSIEKKESKQKYNKKSDLKNVLSNKEINPLDNFYKNEDEKNKSDYILDIDSLFEDFDNKNEDSNKKNEK